MDGLAEPHFVGREGRSVSSDLAPFVPAQPFQRAILRILRMLAACCMFYFARNTLLQQDISPAIPEEERIFPSRRIRKHDLHLWGYLCVSLMAAQKPPSGVQVESEALAQNRQSPFQPDDVLVGAE